MPPFYGRAFTSRPGYYYLGNDQDRLPEWVDIMRFAKRIRIEYQTISKIYLFRIAKFNGKSQQVQYANQVFKNFKIDNIIDKNQSKNNYLYSIIDRQIDGKLKNNCLDLLSVYYKQIRIIEQNYRLTGVEANLKALLEECIQRFYSIDLYKSDDRLLDVFYMLIKRVDNPLELFEFYHNSGFATKKSDFYIYWSNHWKKLNNHEMALIIIEKGIDFKAEPNDILWVYLNYLEHSYLVYQAENTPEYDDQFFTLRRRASDFYLKINFRQKCLAKGLSIV